MTSVTSGLSSVSIGKTGIADFVAGSCFFLSGFLALTYEICWIRTASLVFGAANLALSTVLAVFFAGLALGSFIFGRYSPRTNRPLRIYGVMEIGVGLLAMLTPIAFSAADMVYEQFYPKVQNNFAMLSLIRFLLVVAILLPPTILMGGTLPLFCRQYVRRQKEISRTIGLLYGINTLGAAIGCAVCGFLLIRYVGVNATIFIAASVNVVVGVVVWALPISAAPVTGGDGVLASDTSTVSKEKIASRKTVCIYMLFGAVGFVALGNEVLWARYLTLLLHNSVYTYTLTLTVVLIGIVLGSWWASGYFDSSRRRALLFGLTQTGNGLVVLTVLMLPASFWHAFPFEPFWIVTLIMLLPAVLSGVSFPLAIRMVVDNPTLAGVGVGKMAAINTLGGILGALLAGFVVIPLWGLHIGIIATTGISLLVGFAAWLLLDRSLALSWRLGLIVLCVVAWLGVPSLMGTQLPADFLVSGGKLVDYREGLSCHMAVLRRGERLDLEIDRMWQGQDEKYHQVMAAHIPMLLHQNPREALVVGLGVGQTASRFLFYDIDRLDCAEIESGLVPLVQKHFQSDWMTDPRVRFIFEDGRNFITHTDEKYDVISIEVGQVFRPGIAGFYTHEFYRRARQRLNPGGVISQFLPITFFDKDTFRTTIATFLEVFPNSVLWYNTAEMLLIGTVSDGLSLHADRLIEVAKNNRLRKDLEFAYWGGPDQHLHRPEVLAAGFLMGSNSLARMVQGASIYHDDRPYLEYTVTLSRPRDSLPKVVDLVKSYLDPTSAILDVSVGSTLVVGSESIRQSNLKDIIASSILEPVPNWLSNGENDHAIRALRQGITENPKNFSAIVLLAEALASEGGAHWEEAVSCFERAIEINPNVAHLHNQLGRMYMVRSIPDKGIWHFRHALKIDPNHIAAQRNLQKALGGTPVGDLGQ